MKKNVLTLLAILALNNLFGQANSATLIIKQIDDISLFYKLSIQERDSIYFDLLPLRHSSYKEHIRISFENQVVDIYRNENNYVTGILTNFITEDSDKKLKGAIEKKRVLTKYIEKVVLSEEKSLAVLKKLLDSKQFEIPTDSLIKNWEKRFHDCETVLFEYKLDRYYYQKFYCVNGQDDSVKYKKIISENSDYIATVLSLDSLYSMFTHKLPKGKSYTTTGAASLYIMTEEEANWFEKTKPVRNYLKSIKDSIDEHITSELKKQNIQLGNVDCFAVYDLTFSKYGRLNKVTVSDPPKLKEALDVRDYLKDKREIRKCKRIIRKALKHIDVSKFAPQYQFYRSISFNIDGEFQLYDNTIY